MEKDKNQNHYLTFFRGGSYALALGVPCLAATLAGSYSLSKSEQSTKLDIAESEMKTLLRQEAKGYSTDYRRFEVKHQYSEKSYPTTEYKWITMKESKEIQQKEIDALKDNLNWQPSALPFMAALAFASMLNFSNAVNSGFNKKYYILNKKFDKFLQNAADYCQKTQDKVTSFFQPSPQSPQSPKL